MKEDLLRRVLFGFLSKTEEDKFFISLSFSKEKVLEKVSNVFVSSNKSLSLSLSLSISSLFSSFIFISFVSLS